MSETLSPIDVPRIFVTRPLPGDAMARLREECDLRSNDEERVLSRDEILQGVEGRQGLVCLVTDAIDGEVMDRSAELRVIANMAVGYDNIDVRAATERGILVTNTPGVLTETTADLAWALILAIARRVSEGDRLVRSGEWRGWGPSQLLGTDVHGATLGIVGLGAIGRAAARRGRAFDMEVLYWNRTCLSEAEEAELGLSYRSLENLLDESDFVSIHVAYNRETHHLIGAKELAKLGEGSYLINTARGPVVDEAALIEALQEKRIAGAGLDVYEQEPIVPVELCELDNTVLLPHLGSASLATRAKMATMAVENALAACRGERPPNLVNPEVLESA